VALVTLLALVALVTLVALVALVGACRSKLVSPPPPASLQRC